MGLLLLFWIGFAVVVAVWASYRGRSALGWLLLALVTSPLLSALLLALLPYGPDAERRTGPATHRRCPECAEWVLLAARRCKHCGTQIAPR